MCQPSSNEFLLLARPSRATWCIASIIFVIGIFITRFKGIQVLSEGYIGGFEGDAGLYVWLVKHASHSLFTLPWFSTLPFYPYQGALAWSDNFILPGMAFWALKNSIFNDIAAYNLTLLIAQFLNALISFRLIYSLTADSLSSVSAGFLTLALLPLEGHLGHPQLQFFFFIPLGIFLIFRFFQNPSVSQALLLGVTVACAFLTTVYYAVFLMLLYVTLIVGMVLIHPSLLTRRFIISFCIGIGAPLLLLIPFILPYLHTKELFGERGIYEAFYFSASSLSLLSPPPTSSFFGSLSTLSHNEAHLFVGFSVILAVAFSLYRVFSGTTLRISLYLSGGLTAAILAFSFLSIGNQTFKYCTALAAWSLCITYAIGLYRLGKEERRYSCVIITNRDIIGTLLFTAGIFLFLSFGPLGNPEKGQLPLGIYTVLYYLAPGFDAIRAVGRAGLVSAFLFVLIYFLLVSQMRGARKINPLIFLILLLLPILENQTTLYQLDLPLAKPIAIKEEKIPTGTFIGLPFAGELDANGAVKSWSEFARLQVYFMNWFEDSSLRSVNGYSGQRTKLMKDLPRRLAGFPDSRSLRELAMIAGLRRIVVVPQFMPNFNPAVFEATLGFYKNTLRIEDKDSLGNYLLSYTGETALTPDFILRTPGGTNGISFEVRPQGNCEDKGVQISLINADSEETLSTVNLTVDDKIHWHPLTSSTVFFTSSERPLRIKFKTFGCPLIIRNASIL